MTGVTHPEAQSIGSGLSQSELHVCLDFDDALKQDDIDIDKSPLNQLQELNEASTCIQNPYFPSVPLSEIAAVREGGISEHLIIKMIDTQQVSDGWKVCYTGDALTVERAFQGGLIPASVYVKILQRQKTCQDLTDSNTAENVSLIELAQSDAPCEENALILKGLNRNISLTSGRDRSIIRAFSEGLIDREAMLRLLAAQTVVGGTSDPKIDPHFIVEDAQSGDLMDKAAQSAILSPQMQMTVNLQNGERLVVDEAVQCDLISCSSTLLVLGKQREFMGLILPHSGEILTVSTSLQHEIITNEFTSKLLSNRQKIAAFFLPGNSEVVDISSAIQEGLIDIHTADVLKSIEFPDVFPDVDQLSAKFSSWLMFKELTVDGCHHATDGLEVGDRNINSPSPTEARQLFISYLMMNSYKHPTSGQRLLVLDRQLSKMAKVFIEDSIVIENLEQNGTSLTSNTGDISEQAGLEIPFKSDKDNDIMLQINEETGDLMKNTQELQSRDYGPWENEVISDDNIYANDKVPKEDSVKHSSVDCDFARDNTQSDATENALFQMNTTCTDSADLGKCLSAAGNGFDIEVREAVNGEIQMTWPQRFHALRTRVRGEMSETVLFIF
ncbi:uncharacterized protein ACN63O_013314 [Diretmus argenteus]